MSEYLLQAENERLGTLDLVRLPRLAQRLLDDVTVVVVVLRTGEENTTVSTLPQIT